MHSHSISLIPWRPTAARKRSTVSRGAVRGVSFKNVYEALLSRLVLRPNSPGPIKLCRCTTKNLVVGCYLLG